MKSESKGLEIWKERRIKKKEKKNSLLSRLIGNLRLKKKKKKEKQVENGEKGVAVSIT